MLEQYLPILIFILLGVGFGIAPILFAWIISIKNPDPAKCAPYECGFSEFDDARIPFDVRYYLVALLFIIFDLETAFLFPWAVDLRELGHPGFWAMMFFLGILVIGFIYEWRKGALEWE